MNKYYLRVEAVNFNYFIYDTDKIQPMRGGSYLLLESINSLAGLAINGIKLNKIMAGASIGLFSFELEDGKAEDIAEEVRKKLNDKTGNHATFVVSVLKSSGNGKFEKDNETITAMNRWQQFQQHTLILPEEKDANDKCFYDGVRPGTNPVNLPDKKNAFFSDSVLFRKDKGKNIRPKIYNQILSKELELKFTDDLDDLSKAQDRGNLNGKMAFIYFDGNKFTKIRTELCKDAESFGDFSDCIEKYRKDFLDVLIEKARGDDDFKISGNIRLETLLWGGDEFEIVVPAWKGWEVLSLFYKCMNNAAFTDVQLTHAGGIIFSNHKAPIRQVRNMARKLAYMAKDKLPNDNPSSDFKNFNHKEHDIAHYLIMESFDTVGPDVEYFVKQYYGNGCYNDFYLTSGRMDNINEALSLMKKKGFPRSKIFEIIRIIKCPSIPEQKKKIDAVLEKALSEVEEQDKVCVAIEKVIEGNCHRWLMLADLWDYAGRERA